MTKYRAWLHVEYDEMSLAEIAGEDHKIKQIVEAIKLTTPNALHVGHYITERRGEPIYDASKFKLRSG